jgi:hypothetical protein
LLFVYLLADGVRGVSGACLPDDDAAAGLPAANARLRGLLAERDGQIAEPLARLTVSIQPMRAWL